MGTRLSFHQAGGYLLLLIAMITISPVKAAVICKFGTGNTFASTYRNIFYYNITNTFLQNYTLEATDKMLNVSTFNLTKYLEKDLGWNLKFQTYNVSRGILHQTNWTNVTTGFRRGVDLPSYIQSVYMNPVHTEMKFFANYYVISRGIYRPSSLNFYYSGIDLNSTTQKIVPGACLAGWRVVLQIPTNMTYTAAMLNTNSTEFAVFASMLELEFEWFFRRTQSNFTDDFIRVNVLNIYRMSVLPYFNQLAAVMEFYFDNVYNATSILDYVKRNISLLSPMNFVLNRIIPVSVLAPDVQVIQTNIAPTTPTTPNTPTTEISTLETGSTVPANLTSTYTATTDSYSTANSSTANSSLSPNLTTPIPVITTFDSDPIFLAVAPVLPKKYNDPVMVPRPIKIAHMAPPITESLLKITLPIAAGIIGFVIGLLVCLQSDWLQKPDK